MILLGKGKLAEYIKKQPDAEIHILLWLKEFGIRERKFYEDHLRFLKSSGQGFYGLGFGGSGYQFGTRKDRVSTLKSTLLQTHIIEFVGTDEEHEAFKTKKLEQLMADNPNIKVKEATFTVKTIPLKKAASVNQLADGTADNIEDVNPYQHASENIEAQEIRSAEAYEAALTRVEKSFVKNDVNAVDALLPLILGLKAYEETHITFSELNPLDVIKLKMEQRFYHEYPSAGLLKLAGGSEQLKAYLTGEKPLTNRKLKAFYRYLKVPFELN